MKWNIFICTLHFAFPCGNHVVITQQEDIVSRMSYHNNPTVVEILMDGNDTLFVKQSRTWNLKSSWMFRKIFGFRVCIWYTHATSLHVLGKGSIPHFCMPTSFSGSKVTLIWTGQIWLLSSRKDGRTQWPNFKTRALTWEIHSFALVDVMIKIGIKCRKSKRRNNFHAGDTSAALRFIATAASCSPWWSVKHKAWPSMPPFWYGLNMGVSKNRGTAKSSILIGFSIINHPFWGTPIFGNTHMPASFPHFSNIENSTAKKLQWCSRFMKMFAGRIKSFLWGALKWQGRLSHHVKFDA